MYKKLAKIAILLSVSLYAQASERIKPEWTRTASFKSLTPIEQAELLVQYEKQVEGMADLFRSQAPAPLSVEKDQAIVNTARCVLDVGMAEAVRGAPAVDKLSGISFERTYFRCKKRQDEKLRAAELQTKATKARTAPRIGVFDYLLDYEDNRSSNVTVKGLLTQRADLALLHAPGRTDAFVIVDTTALSRDERKRILMDCARGCEIEIYGQVTDVAGQKGLSAIGLR